MLKIFSSEQIRKADGFTILNEPISSCDLMERAAQACVNWLSKYEELSQKRVLIFCGPGNNGGDGLAMARLLHQQEVEVKVFIPDKLEKKSNDFSLNFDKANHCGIDIQTFDAFNEFLVDRNTIIVDALFGTGLSKPVTGIFKEIIETINRINCITISIDIPSGLFADFSVGPKFITIIQADYTLCFQFPKLSFLFPENELYTGEWHLLSIGLHPDFINHEPCKNYFIEKSDVKSILKPRTKFSHKGIFGHALLVGGTKGKIGASVLMSKSCIRSGAGLVTVHVPGCGYQIIQTAIPEVMVSVDLDENECSIFPRLEAFTAIAVGPGLGSGKNSASMLKHLIQEANVPLILDADALNIISENRTWLAFLPKGTILTPHPGEFARLAGKTSNGFDRLESLREMCIKYSLNIVLKGAFSIVCTPVGNCYFNPTGNPGMATAGSGDVLTGLIAGLLAQGYNPTEACILGVYIHGRAGDLAADENGNEALIAGDIISNFGKAFVELH